jgi:hypothetical protein
MACTAAFHNSNLPEKQKFTVNAPSVVQSCVVAMQQKPGNQVDQSALKVFLLFNV